MHLTEKTLIATLRKNGYKLTPQRMAVIDTIISRSDHLTAAQLYEKVHEAHPEIGLVTVYRTLQLLNQLGLICELHAVGNCPTYTLSNSQHHHHIICSRCGRVVDFTGRFLDELETKLARESGFKIDGHTLEFTGICRTCQGGN
jgi:Fur family transcriptional regulator, ferric uptake regulator